MKIVLAGALGYLGSGLIELIKDDERFDQVVLIDNRFVAPLLANLPEKFSYRQIDIGDVQEMRTLCESADILILLAGITEAEKSAEKETLVWSTNFDKCRAAAQAAPKSTRVIFCSTGNVFGGSSPEDKWQDLTENDPAKPRLPYASSKFALENFLRNESENYTICRFGTVFGYSPGVRFNIVTNLFVRRALQGQHLILYGRGENYRPNVHVMDTARAMLFLATNEKAKAETYHVVRHNMTIHQLAEVVVRHCPKCSIVLDDRSVPFSSYHLSSKKLRTLGFEFQLDLDTGVKDLVRRFGVL